jgi:hypothetical protein
MGKTYRKTPKGVYDDVVNPVMDLQPRRKLVKKWTRRLRKVYQEDLNYGYPPHQQTDADREPE